MTESRCLGVVEEGDGPVDVHAWRLRGLLATPGLLTQAVRCLNEADTTFTELDTALRHGAWLPSRWDASGNATTEHDREHATDLYDRLSSALRETGHAAVCLGALREAVCAWRALDAHLSGGGVLPSPWER